MISISDVRINLVKGNEALKAFASITFDNEFVVKGLRVVEGRNGMFVSYPSTYSEEDKTWYDNCFPINKETRTYIENEVLDAYKDATKPKSKRGK